MFNKIVILALIATGFSTAYSIRLQDTQLYVTGYGRWKNTLLLNKQSTNPDPYSQAEQQLNPHGFIAIAGAWPLYQPITLHLSYSHCVPDQQESKDNILTSEPYHRSSTYQTGLYDLTLHYTLWNLQRYCKIYCKTGIWYLHTHISDKSTPLHEKNRNKRRLFQSKITNDEKITTTDHIGYGGIVGIGVNWMFLRGHYSSLSADLSAAACIPTPTIEIVGPNAVSDILPMIKGGVRWHIL